MLFTPFCFVVSFCAVVCGLARPALALDDVQDPVIRSEHETEVESDFHGLAGIWVLVDRRGSLHIGRINPVIRQVSGTGEVVTSSGPGTARKWHTNFGSQWRVNPNKFPQELDEVRKESVRHRIYELRGDQLTICTLNGSSVERPKKIGFGPGQTVTTYVRGLEKGRKLLAERLAEQYSGDWNIKTIVPRKHVHWSGADKLAIRDGAFVFEQDGRERKYQFMLNPILEENIGAGDRYYPRDEPAEKHPGDRREDPLKVAVPFHIDVTIDGVVHAGVYEEAGTLRFSYFADEPTERPKSIGEDGAVLVELTRVKP